MAEAVSIDRERTYSLSGIEPLAKTLLAECSDVNVWLLYGSMGSGKTTLVKAIMKELNPHENVTSPTFSIVNEYVTSDHKPVYHFDYYRINQEQEAFDIGTEEYFDSGYLCLVEWPEKIPTLIPAQYIAISIQIQDNQTRTLHYRKHG
ncbi:MAG: tRNA (adenosine(37)-N6)-threonylcarbamoyltransferase complex ATPase subunit type 1 TsaE [Bacteroidetes bacterium]|nr:tRNA (adenosine(37)-N6)-threonylcarbamoyltransferase complex ATPase subunit type 1 TsaE [Bacteroidota bacterium]